MGAVDCSALLLLDLGSPGSWADRAKSAPVTIPPLNVFFPARQVGGHPRGHGYWAGEARRSSQVETNLSVQPLFPSGLL